MRTNGHENHGKRQPYNAQLLRGCALWPFARVANFEFVLDPNDPLAPSKIQAFERQLQLL